LNLKNNMKTVYFQIIADSRSCEDIDKKILDLDTRLQKVLSDNNIVFTFKDYSGLLTWEDGTTQRRTDYRIEKTRGFTYNQLFMLVNSIQAPFYKIK